MIIFLGWLRIIWICFFVIFLVYLEVLFLRLLMMISSFFGVFILYFLLLVKVYRMIGKFLKLMVFMFDCLLGI